MTFRLLWNFTAKEFVARTKTSTWYSRWCHRIRHQVGAEHYSRKHANSQWLLKRLRTALDRYGRKAIVLSATGVYNATKDNKAKTFDWTDCNIDDESLEKLSDEMKELESLKMATIICHICKKRLVIDKTIKGKNYCSCIDNKATVDPSTGWQPFLENDDIVIWRKEQNVGDGLYAYKVYGCYNDVSAEDFLAMHIDTDYWRSWDSSALSVRTLERKNFLFGGQCVIHWEMLWPKFFSNRDYVYVRRYSYMMNKWNNKYANENSDRPQRNSNTSHRGLIVVSSRACEHPGAPETSSAFRVKKYWSNLVIKPFTDSHKPGIEFSLTYFDDPGANIPSALQSWVAGQGMPDYLARMRKAATVYREETGKKPSNSTIPIPENMIPEKLRSSDMPSTPVSTDVVINFINTAENVSAMEKNDNEKDNQITDKSTKEFLDLINGTTLNLNHGHENYVKNNSLVEKSVNTEVDNTESSIETILVENNEENECITNLSQQSDAFNNKKETVMNLENHNKVVEKAEMSSVPEKDVNVQGNVSTETQEKVSNQNQSVKQTNYWHLWPLYYFA